MLCHLHLNESQLLCPPPPLSRRLPFLPDMQTQHHGSPIFVLFLFIKEEKPINISIYEKDDAAPCFCLRKPDNAEDRGVN